MSPFCLRCFRYGITFNLQGCALLVRIEEMYGMLKEQGQLLKLIANRESDMEVFGKGIKKWFKKK